MHRQRNTRACMRSRTLVAWLALLFAVVGCGAGASSPAPAQTSSGSAAPTAGPARDRPARARLDAEHEPHRASSSRRRTAGTTTPASTSQILPYASTTPEALIAAGQAECGISFQDALTFAAAAGAPVVSVMAILQHTAQEIAVLASSDITRPRDLDGRMYAGFGYPNEEPTLQPVIKADGGTGDFTTVTLDTAAYEALYAKRADFVITFTAWEGIEAGQRDIELRTFPFTDYGFPDFYQVVLACDRGGWRAEPELARAFVGRPSAASSSPRTTRTRRPHSSSRRTPACSTATQSCRSRASGSSPTGASCATTSGAVGRQTLEQVAGLLGLPVRAGPARGTGRQAARRAARLRGPVHERLPAVTAGAAPPPAGGRRSPWSRAPPALGGLRPARGPRPGHAAGARRGS